MITLMNNGQKIEKQTPTSWNDLTYEQICLCHHILFRQKYSLLLPAEVMPYLRIELVKALLEIDKEYMMAWREDCMNQPDATSESFASEVHELCKITDFFYEEVEDNVYHAVLGLTKNPYPTIQGRSKILGINGKARYVKLFGPQNRLKNISFYEMAYLFTKHNEYLKTKSDKSLNELIATMYRRAKPSTKENQVSAYHGDIRLPLRNHEQTIEGRASTIEHLPKEAKMLILFWFTSCRKAITDDFPFIFKKNENQKSSDNPYGWASVIWNLSDGLHNTEKIQDKNYEDALAYMNYKMEQAKAAKLASR